MTIIYIILGACIGFLPHNFEPARIFMGDSGAMLIGLMLAGAYDAIMLAVCWWLYDFVIGA